MISQRAKVPMQCEGQLGPTFGCNGKIKGGSTLVRGSRARTGESTRDPPHALGDRVDHLYTLAGPDLPRPTSPAIGEARRVGIDPVQRFELFALGARSSPE